MRCAAGKLKIEYRSLETATREPEVVQDPAGRGAGGRQAEEGWDYIELFYHEQGEEDTGYVTESYLQTLAAAGAGAEPREVDEPTATTRSSTTQITTDAQAANNAGFTGTPSFLIGKTGGTLHEARIQLADRPGAFESAIEKLLKS